MIHFVMAIIEAAKYLDVTLDTIYHMAGAGELPHNKMRSLYCFEKKFLDEWKELLKGYGDLRHLLMNILQK